MAGLLGGGRRGKSQAQKDAEAAQKRAEERALSQEQAEMQAAQGRMRLKTTGGMRLLFSPERQEGMKTKLGGGQ